MIQGFFKTPVYKGVYYSSDSANAFPASIREYMKNPPATSKTGVIKSKVAPGLYSFRSIFDIAFSGIRMLSLLKFNNCMITKLCQDKKIRLILVWI